MQNTDPAVLTQGQLADMAGRIEAKAALSGDGVPSNNNVASYIGQMYVNTTNGDLYYCSGIEVSGNNTTSVWRKVSNISSIIVNGGCTAPTASTFGTLGMLYSYYDANNAAPHLMMCTNADFSESNYEWEDILS